MNDKNMELLKEIKSKFAIITKNKQNYTQAYNQIKLQMDEINDCEFGNSAQTVKFHGISISLDFASVCELENESEKEESIDYYAEKILDKILDVMMNN